MQPLRTPPIELRCLRCQQPILSPTQPGTHSTCAQCGAVITNEDGIVDCAPEQPSQNCIPNRMDMRQLNQHAAAQGWFTALIEHFQDALQKIAYISDPVRLGWLFHCYDENASDVCLCVGSAWGSLAFPLSRFYRHVYSVDEDMDRLRFQALRAASQPADNLHLLRAPLLRLPLADNSVDLVVLSGVLEWIGLCDPKRPPAVLQTELLSEARRVLKPGGKLFLGIENRLGVQYFLGNKDHSGLPFTSLLPRPLADLAVRWSQSAADRYRTYTHSTWGYRRLLRRAGFAQNDLYWAWPSYTYPRMSGPLDGRSLKYMAEKVAYQGAGRLTRAAAKISLRLPKWLLTLVIQLFAPQLLIVTAKTAPSTSLQQQVVERTPPPSSFVRLTMGINAQVKTTFLLMNQHNHIYRAVRVVETPGEDGALSTFAKDETAGIRGRPLRPHVHADVHAVGRWLADFQHLTVRGTWAAAPLIDEIDALAESADPLLENHAHRALLAAFTQAYTQAVQIIPLPMTAEHGDFTLPNILVPTEDREADLRVIDWEFKREQGTPLMDVGSFMLSLLRRRMVSGEFPVQITPNTPPAWFLTAYAPSAGLPVYLAPAYYLLRVLDRVRQQPVSPAISHLILAQWTPLLRPALLFGVRMSAATGEDYDHNLGT